MKAGDFQEFKEASANDQSDKKVNNNGFSSTFKQEEIDLLDFDNMGK